MMWSPHRGPRCSPPLEDDPDAGAKKGVREGSRGSKGLSVRGQWERNSGLRSSHSSGWRQRLKTATDRQSQGGRDVEPTPGA